MWYQQPEFWAAVAAVATAVGGLVRATHAKAKAEDAHAIAVGHALDRTSHPALPRPVGGRRPPSSPAGPSSG